ncbi:MAG: ATP-binding protein [Planctomycetota bacterium]
MRRRIVICLGLLLALCLAGDAIALVGLNRSIDQISDLAESHRIQSLRAALESSALRLENDILSHFLRGPTDDEELRASTWRFRDSLAQCASCHHAPPVDSRLAAIHAAFEEWSSASETLFAPSGADGGEPRPEFLALTHRVPTMTRDLVAQAHVEMKSKSDAAKAVVHRAWITLCITLVTALVFGGVVAFHLQRRLTKPLYELLDLVSRARSGRPLEATPIAGDAEFRQLGDVFHEAYHDLQQAQDGALQAEKLAAVGQLAAGVAHEVANPLASISSIVQIMRRQTSAGPDTEQLDLIMNHIDRISRIVREFLDFSRPTRGERRSEVDVSALLDQATQLLAFDERARKIEIVREYEPALPPIRADGDRLALAFTNIVINAIDAMSSAGDGTGTLRIAARRTPGRLVVRFTDDGPGMPEDAVADAFQPFFTTKQPGTGTGLGLWICYETVRRHGGTIQIESRLREGTTVTIELPIDEPAGAERGSPSGRGSGSAPRP